MTRFVLYSRSYCHLCEDMHSALMVLAGDQAAIDVVDIDAQGNEDLLARYDELVPVLIGRRLGQSDQQLCHYYLNENTVRAFLSNP